MFVRIKNRSGEDQEGEGGTKCLWIRRQKRLKLIFFFWIDSLIHVENYLGEYLHIRRLYNSRNIIIYSEKAENLYDVKNCIYNIFFSNNVNDANILPLSTTHPNTPTYRLKNRVTISYQTTESTIKLH